MHLQAPLNRSKLLLHKSQKVLVHQIQYKDPNKRIKQVIWVYFLLLIFEGALRKWVLPALATPLLVIRDPLALWLVLAAYRKGVTSFNLSVTIIAAIGFIGIITAMLFGHGNIFVALYGARILIIQFPLLFVIGKVFNRQDVIKIGKAMIWISIPMTILIALQFYSPQSAWVNRGVGGMAIEGFTGALGYFRPSGTFSFTNGTTLFYSLLTPFIVFFWLDNQKINRTILIIATGCLLAAIPLSISRGLFFSVLVSLIFVLIANLRKRKFTGKMILACLGAVIVFSILSQAAFFQTATGALSKRFENAGKTEGGVKGTLIDRFVLGGMVYSLVESGTPPMGYGLGMGTSVGSMLLTGEAQFLIAEDEWGRVIGELGPVLGILVIIIRVILVFNVTAASYRRLVMGDILPWMLLSFALLIIAQGGWGQPTSLGFFVIAGGLLLASFKPGQNTIRIPIIRKPLVRKQLIISKTIAN